MRANTQNIYKCTCMHAHVQNQKKVPDLPSAHSVHTWECIHALRMYVRVFPIRMYVNHTYKNDSPPPLIQKKLNSHTYIYAHTTRYCRKLCYTNAKLQHCGSVRKKVTHTCMRLYACMYVLVYIQILSYTTVHNHRLWYTDIKSQQHYGSVNRQHILAYVCMHVCMYLYTYIWILGAHTPTSYAVQTHLYI